MKILYVEDNEDNVYMLKNRLSRAGFTVIIATHGTEGVSSIGTIVCSSAVVVGQRFERGVP
jgi:CheY-like chemotaxis protein